MLLAFDVGNTNVLIGIYEGERLKFYWRLSTQRNKTADEFGLLIKNLFDYYQISLRVINKVAISSVVPPLMAALEEMCHRYLKTDPMIVEPGIKTGMPIRFDNPREVGADRIVNSVAAFMCYGGPAIVVDFGTATTFDAISGRGEYLGGAIAPGIGISTEALFREAAKLPRIDLIKPPKVIGKNTIAGMQAGIVYGYIAQVEGIVSRMKKELGGHAFVVATGGFAQLIGEGTESIDKIDPLLTLEGLRIIYQLNFGEGISKDR